MAAKSKILGIATIDRHCETVEDAINRNDFRYTNEKFIYKFENLSEKEERDTPYGHLELLEKVRKYGKCELEVVKL